MCAALSRSLPDGTLMHDPCWDCCPCSVIVGLHLIRKIRERLHLNSTRTNYGLCTTESLLETGLAVCLGGSESVGDESAA
jgi:hypothetical protein